MTLERQSFDRDDQSLAPLLGKTSLIRSNRSGQIVCPEHIDTPLDEFGIPRRVELMRQVIQTLDRQHLWSGQYDIHHVAWPGSAYKGIIDDDDDAHIGSAYRGAATLKVKLPRQLHNYTHTVTTPPPVPDPDVLRQYALEHGQVCRLFDTVKCIRPGIPLEAIGESAEEFEMQRKRSFMQKLEQMEDGYIGIMPDLEYLSQLSLREARSVLRGIARVQGLSNKKQTQRHFFSLTA